MVQNYLEWSRLSGLYLTNLSHADRYKTYAAKLSAAGLVVVVVQEFLEDNRSGIDAAHWRTHSVYEFGGDLQRRIHVTAEALQAIGAERLAAVVKDAKSHSPFDALQNILKSSTDPNDLFKALENVPGSDLFSHLRESIAQNFPQLAAQAGLPQQRQASPPSSDHENKEQLEYLLEQYAAAHASELQADIDRYGDPRLQPGFTLESRQRELENLRQQEFARESQRDDVQSLGKFMIKFERALEKADASDKKSQSRVKQLRRDLQDLLNRNQKLPPAELIPEMAALLPQVEALISRHVAIFQPDHIGDEALQARLRAIGPYETEATKRRLEITWENPPDLECDWKTFSLTLCALAKQPSALAMLLSAVEQLQQGFKQQADEWRQEIVSSFRENYQGQLGDWEMDDYEFDANDDATEASILAHVGEATISITAHDATGEAIEAHTAFQVEWDEEHGYELTWDPDVEAPPAAAEALPFDLGKIALADNGPPLSADAIDQFETKFGLKLPANYRQFLLASNGGTPHPAHLKFNREDWELHFDVLRFFSISGAAESPWPQGSLEDGLHYRVGQRWPQHLLPIAVARPSAQWDDSNFDALLFLVLSGKRAGNVVLLSLDSLEPLLHTVRPEAKFATVIEQLVPVQEMQRVAASLSDLFLKKLKPRPQVALPEWLQAIRQNDFAGFLKWLEGGKLSETFTDLGGMWPMTVSEYLAKEASPDLLRALLEKRLLRPADLRANWWRVTAGSVTRFQELMPLLPQSLWSSVLASPAVWDNPSLLEQLAAAGIDFNAPLPSAINDEGATPLHFAVQCGHQPGVKWLLAHGADPHKNDRYARNAFVWAESGPGFDCLPLLKGDDEPVPTQSAASDAPGLAILKAAADQLPDDVSLMLHVQIKTPSVTRIEKAYYPSGCGYLLSLDLARNQVTYKDLTSPRQDYLHTGEWPAVLFAPILQWPELSPDWFTLSVTEMDWKKAIKSRKYQPPARPDLVAAARSALEQGFNAQEAKARGVRLRSH